MEEILDQDKSESHKEFQRLLADDLSKRGFQEGSIATGVVEAISKGVPVIHTNSGGTREVVRKNGIEIAEQWDYDFSLLDYENPPNINYPKIELKKIDIETDYLCIDTVGQIYENFLNEVKNDND